MKIAVIQKIELSFCQITKNSNNWYEKQLRQNQTSVLTILKRFDSLLKALIYTKRPIPCFN